MDLKTLQCFAALAEQLNFSRAAEKLYLSQPSLSIRIKAMEEELGTPLFRRSHQQVYMTSAAAAILPKVHEILRLVDEIPIAAQNPTGEESEEAQTVILGMDQAEDRTDIPFMTQAFKEVRKRYPSLNVEYMPVSSQNYETMLLSGEVDLCLMVFRDSDRINPDFASIPIMRESNILFAANCDGMTAPEILESRELLTLANEERWNQIYMDWFKKQGIQVRTRAVASTTALLLNLKNGKTAAFLPSNYANAINVDSFVALDLRIPDTATTLAAVWNRHNIKHPIQLIINELQSSSKKSNRLG